MAVANAVPGALARPGPVGRGVRLVLGLAVLYLCWGIVSDFPRLTDGVNLANPLTWIGLAYALYVMPEIIRMVFSRPWSGHLVRGVAGGALVLTALVDFVVSGGPNGGTFGITLGLMLALVLGLLGVSFLLAAALAVPG